jgi:FkbM family methyltransferase
VIEYDTTDELVEHLHRMTSQATVFLEVGAFEAEFSRRVAAEHPDATVLALEANPYNWATYAPTMPDRVEYLHGAACEHDGTAEFQIMSIVNGAHTPQVMGNNGLRQRNHHDRIEYETVTVPALRLDTLLAERGLTGQPCVMWWDVEGAQDRVIAGAPESLASCVALMIEVEEHAYWTGQPLADEVESTLRSCGLVTVARDFEFPYQHNVIFVRR